MTILLLAYVLLAVPLLISLINRNSAKNLHSLGSLPLLKQIDVIFSCMVLAFITLPIFFSGLGCLLVFHKADAILLSLVFAAIGLKCSLFLYQYITTKLGRNEE